MADTQRAQLVELIAAQLDGYATKAQIGRLERLLETSVEARHFYIDHLDTHACLVWERVSAVRALLLEEGVGVDIDHELSTIDPHCLERGCHAKRRVRPVPHLLLAAASLVFVTCLAATVGRSVLRHTERADSPNDGTLVATLTATRDCDWLMDASQKVLEVGARFEKNHLLELRSGVAQVTFANGVEVHLEGPVRFIVQSAMRGLLEHGKLLAQVPPRAIGFCVATPTAEVVDLGTQFGVEASTDGATEVQVLRGRVEVEPSARDAIDQAPNKRVQLVAGEMIVSDAGGLGAIAKARNSDRFSRLANATRNNFSTDPGWTGWANTKGGNKYGWISAVDRAGEVNGRVGGTFARSRSESYYGDTSLSQTFTLNDPISASGLFSIDQFESMDGQIFIGHYSSSTADKRREFIGLELQEGDFSGVVDVTARLYRPDGRSINGTKSPTGMTIGRGVGDFHFTYTYDPTFEADEKHAGPEGKITLRIYNDKLSFDQTAVAVLEGDHRDSRAAFDAFGVGIPAGAAHNDDPKKTAELFIDGVSYSGFRGQ